MLIGPLTIGSIDQWKVTAGPVVTWAPTAASKAKALEAPVSEVPPGYMQIQHIRGTKEFAERGLDYSRLLIAAYDAPGQCDLRTMSYVINAHVRRHDTYRSWFEYQGDELVRHKLDSSTAIKMVPTKHGDLTHEQLCELIRATPSPVEWDCFTFGVVQAEDHFTFFMAIDHIHFDAQVMGVALLEFHMMYQALVSGNPPLRLPDPGSYEGFCVRQRETVSEMTVDSPEIRTWVDYAEHNNGSFPEFVLPLGDLSSTHRSDITTFELMDYDQTLRFNRICTDAGARFVGGIFAAIGIVENELGGAETYYGLSPTDTRSPSEVMTLGWFTGLVPMVFPVAGRSFADVVKGAQESFDSGREPSRVPFDRVLELAPWLKQPKIGVPQFNYFDVGLPPISAFLTSDLGDANIGLYSDGRLSNPLLFWIVRLQRSLMVTVLYPDNPTARESVETYVNAVRSVLLRVVEGRDVTLNDMANA